METFHTGKIFNTSGWSNNYKCIHEKQVYKYASVDKNQDVREMESK